MRKMAGYRRALKEAGLRYDERLVENITESGFQGGYQAFQRLVRRCPEVTALFCLNDPTALGAITAAADMGRRCPEDISVVGFGDAPEASYWRPSLTTFSLSCDAIAAKSIELLIDLRKNRTEESAADNSDSRRTHHSKIDRPGAMKFTVCMALL